MKKILFALLTTMLLLSACSAVQMEDIEAHEYWVRAALKDGNSAGYMTIHNHTKNDDALVGVSSDIANAVEIHLSSVDANGVMQMTPQESIDLPAGGEIELKPGSYHIMIMGLKQDLKKGDKVTLTLHFKNHADITLTVPVEEAADMGGAGMDMGGMGTPKP